MKKRILSLLMAFVMVIGLLPASAMATGGGYPDAEWYNFRNSDTNMGITNAATPKENYTQLKWASQFDEYVGVPILVGGYMYVASGGYFYKLNTSDGSQAAKVQMATPLVAGTTGISPTYIKEKGLIIVPLDNGIVHAFNVSDLSTAWIYQDLATPTVNGAQTNSVGQGGQLLTPMVYHNGYVYGGFSNNDTSTRNFVCLNADNGQLTWYYPSAGGFYWAGPVVVGDHIVVGTEKSAGKLLSIKATQSAQLAEPAYSLDLVAANGTTVLGNQRSSMAYDSESSRVYFTTATGYICSAAVNAQTGELSDLRSYQEPNCTSSTFTPLVYGDYVYYSAGKYNAFYFIVAAKDTLQTVAKVKMLNIAKNAFLLSTAYEQSEKYLYFYSTYNANPGGMTLIKVPTDKTPTNETLVLEEIYDARGYEQYCFTAPICDANGTIYYRNDSKTIFALARSEVEVPSFTTDLSTEQVKVAKDGTATALTVAAKVDDGGTLSYQWQSSTDGAKWTNIAGATETSYTPSTAEVGPTYYRCVVTNTVEDKTASVVSSVAEILVKVLSTDIGLNILANTANKLDGGMEGETISIGGNKIAYVENFKGTFKYIALGATDNGSFEPIKENLTLYQGIASGKTPPTAGNVSNSELYTRRYTTSNFKLPYVASVDITAEDGVAKDTVYIVVDDGALGCYTIGVTGFTADPASCYNAETGISFSDAGQTVTLAPVTTTIGNGNEDKTHWAWKSSNSGVATVDDNGVVTSVGGGTATITFTCGQLTAACTVTSTAPEHTIHSYSGGACSTCGTEEPAAVEIAFSLAREGAFVTAKDNTTLLSKATLSVGDEDCNGSLTINDAMLAAHEQWCAAGAEGFATEESAYGPYITKLWGADSPICGYRLNDVSASGLADPIEADAHLYVFFYKDTTYYSDVYTYFEEDGVKAVAGVAKTFEAKGAATNEVTPAGATVKVYDSTGAEQSTTTVDSDGGFSITFPSAGTYTVELGGTTAYDTTANDGQGGNVAKYFDAAPVLPSRLEVTVMPYVSAKVYVTLSDGSGSFITGKGGDELYRLEMTVEDDAANPDGQVSLREVFVALHTQHHTAGATAYGEANSPYYGDYISKLWGDESGNFGYYFNDVHLDNSGTETGTNDREFADALLGTLVADGDSLNAYLYQDVTRWSDIYTYFDAVATTATTGTSKTLTVKGGQDMSGVAQIPAGAAVKVTNASGVEQTSLNTTVGNDGTFSIIFPTAGTYTVEVRSSSSVYVVPSRCTVTVSAAPSQPQNISVSMSVVNPNGGYFLTERSYDVAPGTTAADLLLGAGLTVVSNSESEYGFYVESINGIGEFDQGSGSGWMYKVDGEFPDYSAGAYTLSPGDYVEWVYTRQLGDDVGGGRPSVSPEQPPAVPPADLPFADVTDHWAAEAITFVYEKGLMTGTDKEVFSPEQELSRAMLVTILYRMEGEPAVTADNTFSDVAGDTWYTNAVIWASQNGIVNGVGKDRFAPDQDITREQMAAMLLRYSDYKDYDTAQRNDLSGYADADSISAWALEALQWANGEGLITGRKADLLVPQGDTTRAETATILMRYLEPTA